MSATKYKTTFRDKTYEEEAQSAADALLCAVVSQRAIGGELIAESVEVWAESHSQWRVAIAGPVFVTISPIPKHPRVILIERAADVLVLGALAGAAYLLFKLVTKYLP